MSVYPADFLTAEIPSTLHDFMNNQVVALFTEYNQCEDYVFLSCAGS